MEARAYFIKKSWSQEMLNLPGAVEVLD
jgi:hypothetical protein